MKVQLTPEQELRGADIGYRRRVNALTRGLRMRFTPARSNGSRWGGDIEGALAELAASLALGVDWTSENQFEPPFTLPDIGDRTEVRWSERGHFLLFDPKHDHADRVYVLVTGVAPTFEIVGYMLGEDCCRDEWLHAYPERIVYRVPASELWRIRE